MATIRVLIVDDHVLFADAIRVSLQRAGFAALVATTGHEAVDLVRRDPPEVVLLDIGLPDQSGLVVGRAIRDLAPDVRIIALSGLDDPRLAQEAVRMGFSGYLTKNVPISRVISALKEALEGRPVGARGVSFRSNGGTTDSTELIAQQLTNREREVLGLLVEGLSGEAIARKLDVSGNTVRTHVQNILSKLQVHSRLEAASLAVRHRLLDVGDARR